MTPKFNKCKEFVKPIQINKWKEFVKPKIQQMERICQTHQIQQMERICQTHFSTNVGKRANFHKIPCLTSYAFHASFNWIELNEANRLAALTEPATNKALTKWPVCGAHHFSNFFRKLQKATKTYIKILVLTLFTSVLLFFSAPASVSTILGSVSTI